MKRGDVWWVDFTGAVGGEIKKNRPAVILSNNDANKFSNRVTVVPLTSQITKIYPWEAKVIIAGKEGKALGNQITTVAKERLGKYIATVTMGELQLIEKGVMVQLGIRCP